MQCNAKYRSMEKYTEEIDEYIRDILSDGLKISIQNHEDKPLVYVTPLIYLNSCVCSQELVNIEDVGMKLYWIRRYILEGQKDEYSFDDVEGSLYLRRKRKLCFYTYTRRQLENNNIPYTLIGYNKILIDNESHRNFFSIAQCYSNIFDFGDIESIYYLLKPKYKKMFRIMIKEEMDNEIKKKLSLLVHL